MVASLDERLDLIEQEVGAGFGDADQSRLAALSVSAFNTSTVPYGKRV